MDEVADIVVGFDQKESVAYHTFVQSVIEKSTIPTRFMPLNIGSLTNYKETHKDGSNDLFIPDF